jgi:hypothetical protein
MGKLDIKMSLQAQKLTVFLGGTIDEDVNFSNHSLEGAPEIEVHLKEVKSINSCGIREWIKWMSTAKGTKINLVECPKVLVDQINMVDGFLPQTAQVQSFFVPYYCEDSGEEKMVLFNFGKEYTNGALTPPAGIKDSGGREMEMDVIEAKYFRFIKKAS